MIPIYSTFQAIHVFFLVIGSMTHFSLVLGKKMFPWPEADPGFLERGFIWAATRENMSSGFPTK